jgi:hypothetical protein
MENITFATRIEALTDALSAVRCCRKEGAFRPQAMPFMYAAIQLGIAPPVFYNGPFITKRLTDEERKQFDVEPGSWFEVMTEFGYHAARGTSARNMDEQMHEIENRLKELASCETPAADKERDQLTDRLKRIPRLRTFADSFLAALERCFEHHLRNEEYAQRCADRHYAPNELREELNRAERFWLKKKCTKAEAMERSVESCSTYLLGATQPYTDNEQRDFVEALHKYLEAVPNSVPAMQRLREILQRANNKFAPPTVVLPNFDELRERFEYRPPTSQSAPTSEATPVPEPTPSGEVDPSLQKVSNAEIAEWFKKMGIEPRGKKKNRAA